MPIRSSNPETHSLFSDPSSEKLLAPDEPSLDAGFRSTLSPEAEWVVLGARTQLQDSRLKRWQKLMQTASFDWALALEIASAHRVQGLLGRHLSAQQWRDAPPSVARKLGFYFQGVSAHSNALKTELAEVSHALESAAIPVVSFKGPTLALSAYGNSVVRPSADLDLLVARENIGRALQTLRAAGYLPEAELSPSQHQVHLRVDSVYNLSRPAPASLQGVLPDGFAVELHWAITSPCLPFDLDFEAIEPRLRKMQLPGVEPEKATVRALAPEDLLLILCVHGAKHLWERLIWICDIAELVAKTPDLDWQKVMTQAQARGVLRMTVLGLVLARDILGAALPVEVQNWFTTQPQALRLAALLRISILNYSAQGTTDGALTRNLSTDHLLMQTIDAPLKRLGFLWHIATTPSLSDRAGVALPPGLDFLWCVIRPARALQKRLPRNQRDSLDKLV